ncbi:MAG: hypothetical protein JNL25_10035 [Rhodospirillaceae bacterium]|nr:hypothetical protein [Rhodospirillaceae bacterium]
MKPGTMILSTALVVLAACSGAGHRADATPVTVSLRNGGAAPIDCRLIFGHWVERDLGTLKPGESVSFPVEQQPSDGALFVMRPDGGARMMIEVIQCGQFPDWLTSVGQVDFTPARRQRVSAITATCSLPPAGGRIVCPPAELSPVP